MGHKKKGAPSSHSLHQQAYDRLTAMLAFGDSRRADKDEDPGISTDKIYSFATYKTYWKHIKIFHQMGERKASGSYDTEKGTETCAGVAAIARR